MDKDLIEASRQLFADNLTEYVREHYNEANKSYIQKQIQVASEYLTEEQKKELRSKGYDI